MVEDSSDAEYVEPARTSYPEQAGIMGNFGGAAKPKKGHNTDDIDMEFN